MSYRECIEGLRNDIREIKQLLDRYEELNSRKAREEQFSKPALGSCKAVTAFGAVTDTKITTHAVECDYRKFLAVKCDRRQFLTR